jgi:hypothetical protein
MAGPQPPMQTTTIVAGDTFRAVVAVPEYPASAGWVLHYRLAPLLAAGAVIVLQAVVVNGQYTLAATPVETAAWAPGGYSWTSWVELGGDVHSVASGQVQIRPDPRTVAPGYDNRTPARAALDAANAAMASYGSKAYLQSISVAGKTMSFQSPERFMAWRSALQSEVAREEAAGGTTTAPGAGRRFLVRVGRA